MVEQKLQGLGLDTELHHGRERKTLSVYGDTSVVSRDEIRAMPGVESLVSISLQAKRAARKAADHQVMFDIGNVTVGDGLVIMAGPCSAESERQLMAAALAARESGADLFRAGVHKYRSGAYSGWEGIAQEGTPEFEPALRLVVKAAHEYDLSAVVEIQDPSSVTLFEDCGVGAVQIGEPNCRNTMLLNRLRDSELPVVHKRGRDTDVLEFLGWTERMMTGGKTNIIVLERGVRGPNQPKTTRNTLDLGSIALLRKVSCLPVGADPSHGTGNRDLVLPMGMAAVAAGANVIQVEMHPAPLIAKSDGFQQLFSEQLPGFVAACHAIYKKTWQLLEQCHTTSSVLEEMHAPHSEERRRKLNIPG